MQAYLDNSATTVCEPGVVEKVVQMMSVAFGIPSAMHNKGVEYPQRGGLRPHPDRGGACKNGRDLT